MWHRIRLNHIKTIVLVSGLGLMMIAAGYLLGVFLIILLLAVALVIFIIILKNIESNSLKLMVIVLVIIFTVPVIKMLVIENFLKVTLIGIIVAISLWGLMCILSFFRGDKILLSITSAKKADSNTTRRLFNIVEEMKIASGLDTMPGIYVFNDPSINAYAVGRGVNHSSIALSSGLLDILNRDEIQGVIGHEIAHIVNRDNLLMMMCSVPLWVTNLFSNLVNELSTSSSLDDSQTIEPIVLFTKCIGRILLTPSSFGTVLFYFAISRKREYLADACSALYTRYPEGLASALEKISTSSIITRGDKAAIASMYISHSENRIEHFWDRLRQTHPPLSDRIRILRTMVSGSTLNDYDIAYREFYHRGKGISG